MKKLLLFFGLICMINLTFAQEMVTIHQNGHDFPVDATHSGNGHLRWGEFNPTVPQDSILFWTGTGSNRAVIAITWNDAIAGNIGIAWGVQWNGSAVSIRMIMDTIAAYDSRFTVSGNMAISNLSYIDSELGLNLVGPSGWWWYNWKAADGSSYSSQSAAADILSNGDFVDWLPMDPDDWSTYPADLMIMATDPNGGGTPPTPPTPPTPTFTVDDIHYWVGTGDASAIVAVSWEEDEVALAWGVHYDDEWYPSVIDLLDSIKTYDPRFDYHVSYYMSSPYNISSISFTEGNLTLSQTNTSNIMVQVLTSEGETDAISGDELEDYSIWDGDFVQISTTGDFNFSELEAVEPPATPVEPEELCNTIQSLPYSEDFSSYTSDQNMWPNYASAPIPECWTMLGNGTVHHVGTGTSTISDYFGGVGYSTSTNNFGAIAANDAFFCLIASQIYTGTNTSHINDMLTTGTRRYAVLPAFDAPLSQTVLTFDHRTNMKDTNTHLMVGYIVNDTADFVALETYTADNRVLHHDTIYFSQYANMPDNARLALKWDVASTTASTTGPGNRYCGIDNLTVALEETTPIDTTPVVPIPEEATIAFSDILYWVGEGTNEAVMAVNWADTALAWGYRWNGEATVANMIADIAAADPRFSLDADYYLHDILFVVSDGDTLRKMPFSYWESKNNGAIDGGMLQPLANGDFEKWAEPAAGVLVDSFLVEYGEYTFWMYSYVYPMTIYPVSVPVTDTTPVVPIPQEATIAFSDILYWVGEGSNEAVMAVNWADTALAWGYRWNGEANVTNMMTDIAAADPRFSYTLDDYGYLNDILFVVSDGDTLHKTLFSYWESKNNGSSDQGLAQTLANGDFEKWAEPAAGVLVDSFLVEYGEYTYWMYSYVYPMTIYPVSVPVIDTTPVIPIPVEATIDFSEILFWVGTGSNEAVMAVNWADTALAWGYRWNGTATVAEMMEHIAAADPRFSYDGTGFINDINFIDTAAGMTTPLGISPGSYWSSTNNGVSDAGMSQTLSNGDLEKWVDSSTGIFVDSVWTDDWGGYWNYIYVYPMSIYPVSVPDTTGGGVTPPDPEHGPFCGGVGTEGCNAIAADDNQFVAWATNVVLTRGPQKITNPDGPFASFGGDTNAIGPATLNNSMDAVSLGDGGSALVTFELPIRNGEGPDFAVFENDINGGFLELAFVEVSSDGEHFVRFPATSLTQTETQVGTFGLMDPTFINNLAGKFQIGYGTPFDLEELAGSENLNIDSIVYVRIVDVIGNIDPQYASYDAFGHIVNDPWPTPFNSCGFDLTGVGVIHQKTVGIEDHDVTRITVYPNPCSDRIYVNLDEVQKVELYNMNGRLLEIIQPDDTHFMLDMQQYPAGMYLLRVGNGVQKIMKR